MKTLSLVFYVYLFHFYVLFIWQFTPGLPKTRSGKIMRRILRKIAANKHDELGDISTLFDPSIVELLVDKHKEVSSAEL